MKRIKILISVDGGLIQTIRSTDPNIDVEIFDCDNMGADGLTNSDIETKWDKISPKYPEVIY